MSWRPDFNLGIDVIDDQHKKIIELINKLNDAFISDAAHEELSKILSEMGDYANYHFREEEKMFKEHNFPFTNEHIEMHAHFIRKVNEFKSKHNEGQHITFRVLGFLRKWMTDHILDADREYVNLIKWSEKEK